LSHTGIEHPTRFWPSHSTRFYSASTCWCDSVGRYHLLLPVLQILLLWASEAVRHHFSFFCIFSSTKQHCALFKLITGKIHSNQLNKQMLYLDDPF